MKQRRAATIVELMVTTAVCATVLGVSGMAYVTVTKRAARDAASCAVAMQASALAEDLTREIRNSLDASVSGSGSGKVLKLTLPNGKDVDGDGVPDQFQPSSVASDGSLTYAKGPELQYYMSDITGNASSGTVLWRQIKPLSGSASPDSRWSLVNSRSRWNLIESIDLSVDTTKQIVKFVIVASSLSRADRLASGTEANSDFTRITLTRVVAMRSGN